MVYDFAILQINLCQVPILPFANIYPTLHYYMMCEFLLLFLNSRMGHSKHSKYNRTIETSYLSLPTGPVSKTPSATSLNVTN